MYHQPKTKEEAKKHRYGKWGGNPKGNKYIEGQCAAEIRKGWIGCQCSRSCGHGPEGLYCKTHAKMIKPTGESSDKT